MRTVFFRFVRTSLLYFATGGIPAGLGGPFDESQSQFVDEKTYSEELRFTSNNIGGFTWIAGVYAVHTARFISTGNLADRGLGIPPVYQTPLVDPTNPSRKSTLNLTFLADSAEH